MKKLVLISILFLVFSISCGVDNSEIDKIDKITPLDTIFSYDSLTKVGFKKNKFSWRWDDNNKIASNRLSRVGGVRREVQLHVRSLADRP